MEIDANHDHVDEGHRRPPSIVAQNALDPLPSKERTIVLDNDKITEEVLRDLGLTRDGPKDNELVSPIQMDRDMKRVDEGSGLLLTLIP